MEMSLAKALAQNELANQLDDNILHQLSRPIVSVASYASGLFSSTKKLAPPTSSFASKSRKRNSVRTSSRMDGKRRSAEHRRIAGGRTHLRLPFPSRGEVSGLAGASTSQAVPSSLATSYRNAAPLNYLIRTPPRRFA